MRVLRLVLIGLIGLLLLTACTSGVKVEQQEGFTPRTRSQEIFVVPFVTIMVPGEVSQGLFDRFVDNLNAAQQPAGLEFIILKQGVEAIDADWLGQRDYLTGEIFAYVEDVGSTTASIRARSRIQLYQAGQLAPTLRLEYPVEIFYEKDYTSLEEARRKLALQISDSMALTLTEALAGD